MKDFVSANVYVSRYEVLHEHMICTTQTDRLPIKTERQRDHQDRNSFADQV